MKKTLKNIYKWNDTLIYEIDIKPTEVIIFRFEQDEN